jgi:hypothetical protein
MAGAGITTAGSAPTWVCQKAQSRAKSSKAPSDLIASEVERRADDTGGGVVGMENPLGALTNIREEQRCG